MGTQEIKEVTENVEDVEVVNPEETDIVPTDYSENDSSRKISAGQVAIGGLAVIGGISVAKWLWKKVKNSKLGQKISEKIKSKTGKSESEDSEDVPTVHAEVVHD